MACDLGRAGPDKGCLLKRGNSLRKNSNPGHCCRVRPTGVSSPRRMAPASPSPTHKIRQCDALLVPPQQGPRPEGPVSTPPQTSPSLGAGSAVSRREQQATPKEKGGFYPVLTRVQATHPVNQDSPAESGGHAPRHGQGTQPPPGLRWSQAPGRRQWACAMRSAHARSLRRTHGPFRFLQIPAFP